MVSVLSTTRPVLIARCAGTPHASNATPIILVLVIILVLDRHFENDYENDYENDCVLRLTAFRFPLCDE